MNERYAEPPPPAWSELDEHEHAEVWRLFADRFGFRASTTPNGRPAIKEPVPSVTFDLSVIPDGPRRGAAYDAINAEALRAFVWALPSEELLVLDRQSPGYRFYPSLQAMTWQPEWKVPVYPNGELASRERYVVDDPSSVLRDQKAVIIFGSCVSADKGRPGPQHGEQL